MRRLIPIAFISGFSLLIQACQMALPLYLVVGSTVHRLVLGVGSPSEPLAVSLQEVTVYPCRSVGPGSASGTWPGEAAASWLVRGQSQARQSVFTYAELPADLTTVHEAERLDAPGCYVIRVLATRNQNLERGTIGVTISATGAATAMSARQLEAAFTRTRA